jgi:PAS domain S-box-containing protein
MRKARAGEISMKGIYQSILNAALDAVITAGVDGRILDINPAAERTFGFKKEDVVGELLSETIVPVDLRAAHEAGMEHWRQTGEGPVLDKRIEVPAMRANGEIFPSELTVTAVNLESGATAFAAYIRDLSEVRAVEERLRLSEFSIERLGDAIFWVDREARIVRVNAAACEALGYSRDELLSMRVFDIDAVMLPEMWDEHWRDVMDRKTFSLLSRHQDKSGRVFPVELSVNYVAHGDDAINCVIARDISQRQKVSEELRRARDAAEAANAAKSEFLAKISHEIRTPLNAVLGFADLLRRSGKLAPTELAWAERINGNSHYLLDLVSDLLDLSKIESGHLEVGSEPCDLRDIVADVDSIVRPQAQEKSLDYRIETIGDVPDRVVTDGLRLRQVLLNLLGNAVKYTARGSVVLSIAWQDAGERTGRLRFDVIDTGVGIESSRIREIFEPFTQLDRKQEGLGGVGLGLNISRRLVQILGGRIEVESRVGEGSTFSVNLGVVLAEDAEVGPFELGRGERRMPSPLVEGGEAIRDRRFLVVDDSPDNRSIVRFLLEGAGALVKEAENGREAIDEIDGARARDERFDIVLMDMQMPVLDGYHATEELRAAGRDEIVIAMTAAVMDDERRRCLAVGCDAFIPKPVVPENFFREIERVLKNGGRAQAQGAAKTELSSRERHLKQLIAKYRSSLLGTAEELQKSIDAGDREGLRFHAHRLKGTGGAYGFPEVSRQSALLESALRAGHDEGAISEAAGILIRLMREIALSDER